MHPDSWDKSKYDELIGRALELVSSITDADLRRVAFDRLLEDLLRRGGESGRDVRKPGRGSGTLPESPKTSKPGPTSWVLELNEEGYFQEPRSTRDILDALAERGHVLTGSDLTWPLKELANRKILRRQKRAAESGGSSVWFYSRW